MKRLIAIDIDGTLLRRSEDPEPEDMRAVMAAREAGLPVILATGRSHFSSAPVANRLLPGMPHVTYNGAWILGPGGELMRDLRVPAEAAREVLRKCGEVALAVRVFVPDCVVMSQEPAPDELFFKYRAFERVDTDIARTLREDPMQLVIVHRDDVDQFTALFAGTHIERDYHWLLTGRDPETPHYWALHLLPRGGAKSAALAQLCGEWGIDAANVLAFGDGINDVDMLQWAGTGVSFPWGVPEAQAAANLISDPDDPHPIATAIYSWLQGKGK